MRPSMIVLLILGIIVAVLVLLFFLELTLYGTLGFDSSIYLYPDLYNEIFLKNTKKTMSKVDLQAVEKGQHIAAESSIVICVLCRNISDSFKLSTQRLEAIGDMFKEYKIVVFENDSEDDSRALLINWGKTNDSVVMLNCCTDTTTCTPEELQCRLNFSKGYDMGVFSNQRMHMMSMFRNKYLNYVKTHLNHFDFMMVFDFDLKGAISKEGIYHSIGSRDNWDAVFANGFMFFPPLSRIKFVYDAVAFVEKNTDISNSEVKRFFPLQKLYQINSYIYNNKDSFVPVDSAFNGLALYRVPSILNANYTVLPNPYNCEHIGLHAEMKENGYNQTFINKHLILYSGIQGPKNKFKIIF